MTPREGLIQALRRLCAEHGFKTVAERATVSEEYLRQIVNGNPLPSKKPRGVGPAVQLNLEAAFPGWAAERAEPVPWPFKAVGLDEFLALPLEERTAAEVALARIIAAYGAKKSAATPPAMQGVPISPDEKGQNAA